MALDEVDVYDDGDDEADGTTSAAPQGRRRSYHATDEDVLQALSLVDKDGRTWIPWWVNLSTYGALLCAVIVTANAVVIGLEVDLGHLRRPAQAWLNFDYLFTAIFTMEMALRVWVGKKHYFVAPYPMANPTDKSALDDETKMERFTNQLDALLKTLRHTNYFNILDLILVLLRLVDVCLTNYEIMQDTANGVDGVSCADDIQLPCSICICKSNGRIFIKLLTTIRLVRVGLAVKHVRLVKGFRELWLIMAGLADTCKTLVWVLGLLLLIMWVLAIVMAVAIGHNDSLQAHIDYTQSAWDIKEYWGTTVKSLFTLFQIITLDKWSQSIVWPLVRVYPLFIVPFVGFMCIAVICLLNLITGVVVESTLTSAQANSEREGKELQQVHTKVMQSLEQIFRNADEDGNGYLDRQELSAMIKEERVRDRLRMLDIPLKELDRLYTLLAAAADGDDGVKIDKFFRGVSRLRGPAMACDLYHMDVDLQRHIKQTSEFKEQMAGNNNTLGRVLDLVNEVDREIIRGEDDDKDPVLKARRGRARTHQRSTQLRSNWVGGDNATERDAAKRGFRRS